MKITYHGHSCVQIVAGDKSLVIDPFLTGNELAVTRAEDIQADTILLTHAHGDHMGDVETIARNNGATVVAIFELANYLAWKGLNTIDMNIGGSLDLGYAQVKMIQAFHSSGILLPDEQKIIYAGMPAGFIVRIGEHTLLHSGDTCLFGDMKIIGERHDIDVAFLPIGDRFTMGPEDAMQAAEWLQAKQVIPIHYDTFPPIQQDGDAFARQLESKGIKGLALRPGQSLNL